MYILCMHNVGLIPYMSDICQPMVAFLFFKIFKATSTRNSDKFAEKITGRVLLSPRNAYLKWDGSIFYSSLGDSSIDDLGTCPNTLLRDSQLSFEIPKLDTSKNYIISVPQHNHRYHGPSTLTLVGHWMWCNELLLQGLSLLLPITLHTQPTISAPDTHQTP